MVAGVSLFGSDGTPGLLKRVLGPTADSLGEALARWVDFRTANVGRILESASRQFDGDLDDEGQVTPRVAAQLLEDGSYCDDDVMVEYLGGVLASARTPIGRDDRAARWVSIVTALSVYEVRLHFLMYSAMSDLYRGTASADVAWGDESAIAFETHAVFVEWNELAEAMDFVDGENGDDLAIESMHALAARGLIGGRWRVAPVTDIASTLRRVAPATGGMIFSPSTAGVQLWMWAHGRGNAWRDWLTTDLSPSEVGISIPTAVLLTDLPEAPDPS